MSKISHKTKAASIDVPDDSSVPVSKADQISAIVENAKNSPQFSGLSDEQKEVAMEIVKGMFDRFPTLDFPIQNADGTIEMDLMLGGHIKLSVPKGYQVMAAQREMTLTGEKGEKDDMLPVYVLAACAEIDGEPASIFDIHEKLSARDFTTLLNYFRSINLL